MNASLSPTILFLLRPAAALAESLSAARDALRGHSHGRTLAGQDVRTLDTLAGLNEHMLKDIGAPDAMIARAVARRQASLGHQVDWPSYSRFD